MEIEKLIVVTLNEIVYYLLKKDAHIISSEIVSLEKDFHILIEANMPVGDEVLRDLSLIKKIKDHPELKYYSALGEQIGNLQGIYSIAPYLNKIDFDVSDEGLKVELFVRK
uniref:Uncharacterized protein n=1 Tax=Fervidobacterium nodosum TaxID=2424 RepID=A0A7C5Y5F5_9BACT